MNLLIESFRMCIQEDPVALRFKCGHTANDIPQSRIVWCKPAIARGSLCDKPGGSTKASSRGYAARNECGACREIKKGGDQNGDDNSGGEAGADSSATKHFSETKVH